ncbi:MAG TPA: hypothetical protein VN701_01520 [Candidatus Paceibacterota bacterium]|nr:hypothetical protein [Candidatus Paceibacterota bacterium]
MVYLTKALSPAAQGLVDSAIKVANENGDENAIDRAFEHAVADLSLSLPQGKKYQVTEALTEIAKAYVRSRLSHNSIEGRYGATMIKLPEFGPGLFFRLDQPLRNMQYAVALSGTPGFVDFWNKVGKGNPEGRHVTILKMRPGADGFKVEEFITDECDPSNNE